MWLMSESLLSSPVGSLEHLYEFRTEAGKCLSSGSEAISSTKDWISEGARAESKSSKSTSENMGGGSLA